jgi:ssRNA-specific RNase YbeY (16S rRNA maturation enzyme)
LARLGACSEKATVKGQKKNQQQTVLKKPTDVIDISIFEAPHGAETYMDYVGNVASSAPFVYRR